MTETSDMNAPNRRTVLGVMAGAVPAYAAAVVGGGVEAKETSMAQDTAAPVAVSNKFIYIHETIEITVKSRTKYLDHFVSWAPTSRKLYNMRLCGVWAVNGSTHRWPEAVVLWELDGGSAFSKMLSGEYAHLKDPNAPAGDHYTLYWGNAPEGVTDTKGTDRLLAPTSYTHSLAENLARKINGAGFLHETIKGPPGSINAFLDRMGKSWVPIAERLGLKLVGAYRSMLLNDSEAVALWAIPTWDDWVRYEAALHTDREAVAWRAEAAKAGIDWEGKFLNQAKGSPFNVGKIL
jgi:hypothetical protein